MKKENFKILPNGNRITCGIIIMDKYKNILGGHGTNKQGFDLLKGCCDENESDLECALRELREESGIILNNENIIDIGIKKYVKGKDIHLFLYKIGNNVIDLKSLNCTSYFETKSGKMLPEINYYRMIKKDERHLFYRSLQNVFKEIPELN